MIDSIVQLIQNGRTFLVASHENPDGDAVGSTLALALMLREMGKEVIAYNRDKVSQDYSYLPGFDMLTDQVDQHLSFDVGFVLDAGELERAGSWIRGQSEKLVNIDHHPFSEDFGDLYYVDSQASATGAMVYRILQALDHPLSLDVAICIYTAILSDTGSFRYSNANPEAFLVASAMIERGVDPWSIASGLYESQETERLKLLALSLSTLRVSQCGRYASLAVTLEMYRQSGSRSEHTDRFINYPRSIRGVEVAIFFRQLSREEFKVGFRSRGTIDVGALARAMGGGGHHNAAGATVQGSLEFVQDWVFDKVEQLLPLEK